MIISASRRTDIPAFYSRWLLNRIRAGYCLVPNPFNPKQISEISLAPEKVDIFVFWTRNPKPLISHLKELDERGYHYYFLYTLMDNPRILDPKSPSCEISIQTFRELSDIAGPEKVIWRYDPVILGNNTTIQFHKDKFDFIAQRLRGYTSRCIISFLDIYKKIERRMKDLAENGFFLKDPQNRDFQDLLSGFSEIAERNKIEMRSCASKIDLEAFGIPPGKCIDDSLIGKITGKQIELTKDPYQRKECGCVVSKDIGMYDSCLYECRYCYATTSFERAKQNYKNHDPDSPSLIPIES
jgi:DNA repair photolyase